MIIQHIRKTQTEISPRKKVVMKRTHKIGTLVAFRGDHANGPIYIGWSAVNRKAGDTFRKHGISMAKSRAKAVDNSTDWMQGIPLKFHKHLPGFVQRCERYYKQSIPCHK